MIIIGIDPGINGAIVINDGQQIHKHIMPKIGKEFDKHALCSLLKSYKNVMYRNQDIHVFVEDVHAIFGCAAGSTFTFGEVVGSIETALIAFDFAYTKVQPKIWQKEMWQGIPEQRKPATKVIIKGKEVIKKGAIDTKAMSLLAKKRLFPSLDLRPTPRCTNEHDGMVDAVLICEYGRRRLKA